MGCSRIKYKISLYIDHLLDEKSIKRVEAHLARCPDCRDYYKDIVEIRGYCSGLSDERVPRVSIMNYKEAVWRGRRLCQKETQDIRIHRIGFSIGDCNSRDQHD